MDIQKLLDDARSKADVNGDGKLNKDDIDALAKQHGIDEDTAENLKGKADANGDGKVDFEDIKSVVGNAGDAINDMKDNLFGKK